MNANISGTEGRVYAFRRLGFADQEFWRITPGGTNKFRNYPPLTAAGERMAGRMARSWIYGTI